MSINSFIVPPMPKSHIGLWTRWALIREGRKDAKKYLGLKDYTRTHILIAQQSISQRGQTDINTWLVKMSSTYLTGNTRIQVEAKYLEAKITELKSNLGSTGRKRKAGFAMLNRLMEEFSDFESQYKANQVTIRNLINQSEVAMPAWTHFYDQKAAIYTMARARKAKVDVDSVKSEIPVYEPVGLSELPGFDDPFLKPKEFAND